jgi:hypothetical protein
MHYFLYLRTQLLLYSPRCIRIGRRLFHAYSNPFVRLVVMKPNVVYLGCSLNG